MAFNTGECCTLLLVSHLHTVDGEHLCIGDSQGAYDCSPEYTRVAAWVTIALRTRSPHLTRPEAAQLSATLPTSTLASAAAGASFANQICSADLGGCCDCHVGGEGTAAVASVEAGSAQFASTVLLSLVEGALSAFRPRVLPASASPRARMARPPEATTARRG